MWRLGQVIGLTYEELPELGLVPFWTLKGQFLHGLEKHLHGDEVSKVSAYVQEMCPRLLLHDPTIYLLVYSGGRQERPQTEACCADQMTWLPFNQAHEEMLMVVAGKKSHATKSALPPRISVLEAGYSGVSWAGPFESLSGSVVQQNIFFNLKQIYRIRKLYQFWRVRKFCKKFNHFKKFIKFVYYFLLRIFI